MSIEPAFQALRNSEHVQFEPGEPITDVAGLAASLVPHFGTIEWTPPPSYVAALALGTFSVERTDPKTGVDQGFRLLDADDFASVNEDLVHMPEGVSIDDGVYLSTNHLVGFAEAGSEAVWCFDVSASGPEYPVYYHHQDQPRARVLESGEWADPEGAEPDFASFTAWLEAMSTGFTATPAQLPAWFEHLGEPVVSFR